MCADTFIGGDAAQLALYEALLDPIDNIHSSKVDRSLTSFVATFRSTASPKTAVSSALDLGKGMRSMTSAALPKWTKPQQPKQYVLPRPQARTLMQPLI